jgi:ethanolamine utilization protein EutA
MTRATTFFSSHERTLDTEDKILLTSVGIDIGSSTTHLVFSKILMERRDNIYVVSSREILFESEVVLTPYKDDQTIDAAGMQLFLESQYARAGIAIDDVDAGALILTGVAVQRRNARAIGELFADQAGKLVAVSAGDSLETALVAYGSGAVALSDTESTTVMNVDIGGGTSKIALCVGGKIVDRTAIDVGARLLCFDAADRVTKIEAAGQLHADASGVVVARGKTLTVAERQIIVERMADSLFQAMAAVPMQVDTPELMRLDVLSDERRPDVLTVSGGVSEYFYAKESQTFGDLGPMLAAAVRQRAATWGVEIRVPEQGIRATVIGASQYAVQVSGSTIFVTPEKTLPLRNIAVVSPDLPLGEQALSPAAIATAIKAALKRHDLHDGRQPVALYYCWQHSATYERLDSFCRGVIEGFDSLMAAGQPLIFVTDSDLGGLIGLHCYESLKLTNPVVSIDGIVAGEFDYIDIGEILDSSGVAPVVIKSLVFP